MPNDDAVYDTAQVCPNGHVANQFGLKFPEYGMRHCDKCGEMTVMSCANCSTNIRGGHLVGGIGMDYDPPAHCFQCGHAFPWTERGIQAAIELYAEELGDEPQAFRDDLEAVANDTPRATVAAVRLGKVVAKFGKVSARVMEGLLVKIASDTAAKVILGGQDTPAP